jgi:3-oxoacyl-[acyl-carrier protein] reductase
MSETILVTGASSDIGLTLLRALLQHTTARVLAHGFSGVERFKPLSREFGDRIVSLQADLSKPTGMSQLVEAVAALGVPSSIVHLPALKLRYDRFTRLNWDSFELDMAVQVRSAIMLLQHFLPKMARLPRARVVFVLSSVVHGIPPKFMSQYTIAKYAQLGLMRALAAEYASSTIRINAVSPSMVETQFLSELNELAIQGAAASNPLGRNAKPEDVVGAIQFLLSPAADYISGIALPIAAGTVS